MGQGYDLGDRLQDAGEARLELQVLPVNGEPGILARRAGQVSAVWVLTLREGLITRIEVIADPRKLPHLGAVERRDN